MEVVGSTDTALFAGAGDIPPGIVGPAGHVGCDVNGAEAEGGTGVEIEEAGNDEEVLAPVPNTVEEPAPNTDFGALTSTKADVEEDVTGPNVVPPKAPGFAVRLPNADDGVDALADGANADPEGPKAEPEPNELGDGFDASPTNADVPEAEGVGTGAKLFWCGKAVDVGGKLLVSHSVALFATG